MTVLDERIKNDSVVIKSKKNSTVEFNKFSKVVLIPSRQEYKSVIGELWWDRSDYSSFQQSASSELRLFSICENVCFQEAKRKLYQPNGDSRNEIPDDSYFDYREMQSPRNAVSLESPGFKALSSRSSIDCLSALAKAKDIEENEKSYDDEALSLCVVVEEPIPLVMRERESKYAKMAANSTNNLLTIIGFFSFTVSVFGYYMIYYQH